MNGNVVVALLATLLVTAILPQAIAANKIDLVPDAHCTGDPCAATKCSYVEASAHAVGSASVSASASATIALSTESAAQQGTAHAEAVGVGPTSASASGTSTTGASASASCHAGGKLVSFPRSTLMNTGDVPSAGLSVGCVVNGAVTASGEFTGRLYVGPEGHAALYDEARGEGLPLASLDMVFSVGSLAKVGPMDVAGMNATDLFVTFGLTAGGQDGTDRCEAYLVG